MKAYHKIQTMWKRDPDSPHGTVLEGQWALPEFEFLAHASWEFTEKVDGVNVRVVWDGKDVDFRGKTDDAEMPTRLHETLVEMFDPKTLHGQFGVVVDVLGAITPEPVKACLYGEGYGARTHKGGGKYRQDNGFVLFDVRVGEWWLRRPDVKDVAKNLGLDLAPVIGEGTLLEMADRCENGFTSTWGDFQAEGIVARPTAELRTRGGDRIITKLKCKDFRR